MKAIRPLLATASALFATAAAEVIGYCPLTDRFCMSIGVPQSSAQAGEGTVYFQVQSVADSYSWVAIGTGTIMSDSNIFVFYPDGTGNVTVSTRRGTGHTLPPPQRDTRFELLAGSGIENGVMTANVACFNCESWDGGDMDLTGRSTAWIAAWKEGSPLNTQSVDTRIAQHDGRDQFRFDLTQATITEDTNPFVNGDTNEDEGDNGNNGNNGDTGNDGSIGSGNTDGASTAESSVDTLLMHGIIMTVTFTFLYPLGSMLIPLAGKWYIHAGCQVVAFLTMWAGFASGYITARTAGKLFRDTHTILGTVIVSAMVLQPILGLLHHRHYVKHHARSSVSHIHIWYGRILLVLGVVNGGIGLYAAGSPPTFTIAYAVVAAASGVAYIASVVVGGMRKKASKDRRAKEGSYSPSSSRGDYGADYGNPYGYQSGGERFRNQQYQFPRRDQHGRTR
ncbi:hypothetical protein VUR80DRAFT_6509 [Thermomyces stellatus]